MNENRLSFDRISEIVDQLIRFLTKNQIRKLIQSVETKDSTQIYTSDFEEINPSPSQMDLLKNLLGDIKDKNTLIAIMSSLNTYLRIGPQPRIELCWTGPLTDKHVRLTGPALSELILSAKHNILIVGYSISKGIENQLDYLKEKSKLGVRLTFMIDKLEGKEEFQKWLMNLPMPAEIYNRPLKLDDSMSALHIKCVVVDDKKAMFGSANLTYHGMKGNIELGLIINDEKNC